MVIIEISDVSAHFQCPLSGRCMKQPVILTKVKLPDNLLKVGRTVDRLSLEEENIKDVEFVPNENLRKALDEFVCIKTVERTPIQAIFENDIRVMSSELLKQISSRFRESDGELIRARKLASEPSRNDLVLLASIWAKCAGYCLEKLFGKSADQE